MEWMKHMPGDERVIKRFAILPIIANGCVKWFTKVKIHQSYDTGRCGRWCNDWFEN